MRLTIGIWEKRPGVYRLRYKARTGRSRYRTIHGTRTDAERAAAAWRAELAMVDADLSATTSLAECIRRELRLSKLAPGTLTWYARLLRLYIEPKAPETEHERAAWRLRFGNADYGFAIGRKQVGRIRLQDGMDFQTYLQDGFIARAVEGIGHTTGSKAIMETLHLCRRGLAYAHEHGAIARNPWARLRIARYQEPSIKTLTTNRELAALQETAATIGGRTGMLLQLAWATGARRGELLALRWIDVDLTARQLAIGASLYEENGVCTRRPTKTRNSERSITLPATMVGELKAWRATQLEHAMANGWVAEFDYSPVLGDPLGNYWSPATASQAARRALHSGGLKVSLHSIRHSHGSMLLGKPGINPLAAASRLGHRNVKMLLRTYGHVMEGDDAAAAAAIDTVMAGKR